MQTQRAKVVIVCDVNGTLVNPWPHYDDAFGRASKEVFGQSFSISTDLDGKEDPHFPRKSNTQVVMERARQAGLEAGNETVSRFFERFGVHVMSGLSRKGMPILPRTRKLLKRLVRIENAEFRILSNGPRERQEAVLQKARLDSVFNLKESLFIGEFGPGKSAGLRMLAERTGAGVVVYIGDTPEDMTELRTLYGDFQTVGIRTVPRDFTEWKALYSAKAQLALRTYSRSELAGIVKYIETMQTLATAKNEKKEIEESISSQDG